MTYLLYAAHSNTEAAFLSPICQEGMDMPYGDILFTNVSDASSCYRLCNATDACIAFVVNDCDGKHVLCWLKSEMNTQTPVACRCLGILPPRPPRPIDLMAQTHKYIDYILSHQVCARYRLYYAVSYGKILPLGIIIRDAFLTMMLQCFISVYSIALVSVESFWMAGPP